VTMQEIKAGVRAVTLSAFFGYAGGAVGLLAAGLWSYASCIRWNVGRKPGMMAGDNGPHKAFFGFFGERYFTPNALGPYLDAVSLWNSLAAAATAVSMTCWVIQTFLTPAP
jgi:hypothetical protein